MMPISRDLLVWQGGALRLHHTLPWSVLTEGRQLGGYDWREVCRTLNHGGSPLHSGPEAAVTATR